MNTDYPDFVVTIEGKQYDCHPVTRQEYKDCYFETGFIDNHPKDPMYLLLHRNGEETFIYMRHDEIAAIAWVLTGLLWSDAMNEQRTPILMTLAKDRKRLEIAVGVLNKIYNYQYGPTFEISIIGDALTAIAAVGTESGSKPNIGEEDVRIGGEK